MTEPKCNEGAIDSRLSSSIAAVCRSTRGETRFRNKLKPRDTDGSLKRFQSPQSASPTIPSITQRSANLRLAAAILRRLANTLSLRSSSHAILWSGISSSTGLMHAGEPDPSLSVQELSKPSLSPYCWNGSSSLNADVAFGGASPPETRTASHDATGRRERETLRALTK